jgi:hypothetical protein
MWVTLQVALGAAATQVSTATTQCRHVMIQNNAAAVCRVGDANVSATRGISLAAAGAAGSIFNTGPSVAYESQLSEFFLFGTSGQIIDVFYCT